MPMTYRCTFGDSPLSRLDLRQMKETCAEESGVTLHQTKLCVYGELTKQLGCDFAPSKAVSTRRAGQTASSHLSPTLTSGAQVARADGGGDAGAGAVRGAGLAVQHAEDAAGAGAGHQRGHQRGENLRPIRGSHILRCIVYRCSPRQCASIDETTNGETGAGEGGLGMGMWA